MLERWLWRLFRRTPKVCPMCGGSGWVLEAKTEGGPPVALELVPCLLPDCTASGQAVSVLSVNLAGFDRAVMHPGEPLVMSVTKK